MGGEGILTEVAVWGVRRKLDVRVGGQVINDPGPADDFVEGRRFEQVADDEPEVLPILERRDVFGKLLVEL